MYCRSLLFKSLLTTAILLFASAVTFFIFVWPAFQKDQLAKLDLQTEKLSLKNKKGFNNTITSIRQRIEISHITPHMTELEATEMLEKLLKKHHLQVIQLKNLAIHSTKNTAVLLNITARGQYAHSIYFLQSLYKKCKVCDITTFTLKKTSSHALTLDFRMGVTSV